jgi:large subunit ribosomal protein L24
MASKIKVGDTVLVRTGKDKGATGKVVRVSTDGTKVLVDGVNVRTRHQKPNQGAKPAGIYKEPRMISISNVGLAHPTKKGVAGRVGFELTKDGTKKRIYRANGKEIK